VEELSPQRRYAEEAGVVLAGMGLAPAQGKLLGWLLICDPPQQTGTEMARALGLSIGSVSTGIRVLENASLVRRVPIPGRRGIAYEMAPDAITQAAGSDKFRIFRELMDRGLAVAGGRDAPGAARLAYTRDFYAFVEREMPKLLDRFRAEYPAPHGTGTGAGARADRPGGAAAEPIPRGETDG
jgi:DNA-binding MarR family transcriptional regulator